MRENGAQLKVKFDARWRGELADLYSDLIKPPSVIVVLKGDLALGAYPVEPRLDVDGDDPHFVVSRQWSVSPAGTPRSSKRPLLFYRCREGDVL